MSNASGRAHSIGRLLARAGVRLALAGLFLFGAVDALQNANAEGDTRTLTFHHVHTGETITVTFKRDGHYVDSALTKLDWFMRDWRKEQQTHMDPHLFDLLWQVYHEVGATEPIDIICGYRSPATNAMLRARSSGVARFSQHTLGHAIDFFIPGVPLAKIREIGLKMQRGGVGFYPTSGSPFVHMDTGTVRHWPRIAREQLVKIFPDGRTVHIPADGKPLRNYALALADVERRGNAPNAVSLEQARAAGVISERDEQVASNVVAHEGNKPSGGNLFAKLFGFNKARNNDIASEDEDDAAPRTARAPTVVAHVVPAKQVATSRIVPLPAPRPKTFALADASSRPAPATPATPAAVTDAFNDRSLWRTPVEQGPALPPPASPFEVATGEPSVTGSTDQVMAYAATQAPAAKQAAAPAAKARPMGAHLPRLISTAHASVNPLNSTVVTKSLAADMAIGGQRWGSPWLRAAMLTPSVSGFMTMTHNGKSDPHWLSELFYKPAQAVMMSFVADPQQGMVTDRFSGSAVVFLATTTFTRERTASLQ